MENNMKNYTVDSQNEAIIELSLKEYRRKPGNVHAVQINEPFTVTGLEGTLQAKAGSYLVFGDKNDVWPVEEDIFNSRYELKPEYKEFLIKLEDVQIGENVYDVFDEYLGVKVGQPAELRKTDYDGWENTFHMDKSTEVLVTRDINEQKNQNL